jgi:hypothetical protein
MQELSNLAASFPDERDYGDITWAITRNSSKER